MVFLRTYFFVALLIACLRWLSQLFIHLHKVDSVESRKLLQFLFASGLFLHLNFSFGQSLSNYHLRKIELWVCIFQLAWLPKLCSDSDSHPLRRVQTNKQIECFKLRLVVWRIKHNRLLAVGHHIIVRHTRLLH